MTGSPCLALYAARELGGIAVLFEIEGVVTSVRIVRKIAGVQAEVTEVGEVNFQPAVAWVGVECESAHNLNLLTRARAFL
jgi:hypothetical protein